MRIVEQTEEGSPAVAISQPFRSGSSSASSDVAKGKMPTAAESSRLGGGGLPFDLGTDLLGAVDGTGYLGENDSWGMDGGAM